MEVKTEEEFKTEEMNFEKVLSFHLNRILMSPDSTDYIHNVEKFTDIVAPFLEEKDKDIFNNLNEEEENEIRRSNTQKKYGFTYTPLDDIKSTYARKKMRIIMGFINRKGWLIDRSVYGDSMPDIGEIDPVYWSWIRPRQLRITRYNQNWLCLICGGTGSGKSYTAGSIAIDIDPSFLSDIQQYGVESRIAVGDSEKFLKILNSDTIRKGMVIIFDEAGVGIPSREWWDECNRLTDYVLQTFRHMNLGVIFTTPDTDYLDSHARKVFHDYLETIKIDYNKDKCYVKPLILQNNPRYAKIYYHTPRYRGVGIKQIGVTKPPKEFIDLYEPLKVVFSKELNKEAEETMKRRKRKEEKKRLDDDDLIKIGKEEGLDFMDIYKVMGRFKIGHHRARRIRERLKMEK